MPVKAPRAWLNINGEKVGCIEVSTTRTKTKGSDSFEAKLDISKCGGLDYWTSVTSIKDVEVVFACVSSGTTLVTGDVTSIKLDLLCNAVDLTGKCNSNKLNKAKTTEQIVNKTAQQAVQNFASRHGLSVNMQGGGEQVGRMYQIDTNDLTHGETEWDAIHRYLEQEGLDAWVSNNTLNVVPIGQTSNTVQINYSAPTAQSIADGTAIKITPSRDLDIAGGVQTSVKSWNSKKAQVMQSQQGSSGGLNYEYYEPDLTQAQADKLAKSRHKRNTQHELKIDIERSGDETVDVSYGVNVSGVGGDFDTSYTITSITDEMSQEGYTQTLAVTTGKAS